MILGIISPALGENSKQSNVPIAEINSEATSVISRSIENNLFLEKFSFDLDLSLEYGPALKKNGEFTSCPLFRPGFIFSFPLSLAFGFDALWGLPDSVNGLWSWYSYSKHP